MRCLMCGKDLMEGSLTDILIGEDPLCSSCRSQWEKIRWRFRFHGVPVYASYLYNEAFSACLIQYKECCDEALADVFLTEEKNRVKRMYRGWTMIPMPSTPERQTQRGFHHLRGMLACTGLPVLDAFEKTAAGEQKKQDRAGRLKMADAIRLKEDAVLPEKIVLFDDTVTTGSTILGALRCLEGRNIQIRIYAVSVNYRWVRKNRVSLLFKR